MNIMIEKIKLRIEKLRKYVDDANEYWENWERESQTLDYEGAGSYFGHSDDCFYKGEEHGELEALRMELHFLETLIKDSNE